MPDNRTRPHNIYIADDLWDAAVTVAKHENTSTAKVITTALGTYLSTKIQFEVDASGPTHRKPPIVVQTTAHLDEEDDVPV